MAKTSSPFQILVNAVLLIISAGGFAYLSQQLGGMRLRIDKLEQSIGASSTNAEYARKDLERTLQKLEDKLDALRFRDVVYFPPGAFGKDADRDASRAAEFAGQLRALRVDSMWERADRKERRPLVRLLWSPASGPSATLEVRPPDPPSTFHALDVVRLGEPNTSQAGKIVKNSIWLSPEHDAAFVRHLSDIGFWSAPATTEPPDAGGKDRWLLEGVKDGRYRLLAGDADDPVFQKLGRFLLEIGQQAAPDIVKPQNRSAKRS